MPRLQAAGPATAGTFMHRSHASLKNWFRARHLTASHSNGMSALQLQSQLGAGSCKTARLLIRKIRRAMKKADSPPLEGAAEADETSVRHCVQDSDDPVGGRSPVGKPMIAGATARARDPALDRRVFSNPGAWGLGVLHGFRSEHPDWQLAEWSFRWNWRNRRGGSFLALIGAGLQLGDIVGTEA